MIYVQCPLRNNSPTSPHFSGFIWCIVFHWACHILRKMLSIWIFCLLPNLSPIIGQTIVKIGGMITGISYQFSVSLNFWNFFYQPVPLFEVTTTSFPYVEKFLLVSIPSYLCFSAMRRHYVSAKIIAHFRVVGVCAPYNEKSSSWIRGSPIIVILDCIVPVPTDSVIIHSCK